MKVVHGNLNGTSVGLGAIFGGVVFKGTIEGKLSTWVLWVHPYTMDDTNISLVDLEANKLRVLPSKEWQHIKVDNCVTYPDATLTLEI